MPSKKNDAFSGYKPPLGLEKTALVADFLCWAAVHMPDVVIGFQQIVKVVWALPKLPVEKSPDVKYVRGHITGIKKHLLKKGRGLDVQRGLGMRATDGVVDAARSIIRPRLEKIFSQENKLVEERALANGHIPNNEEGKECKEFIKQVDAVILALDTARIKAFLEDPIEIKKKKK